MRKEIALPHVWFMLRGVKFLLPLGPRPPCTQSLHLPIWQDTCWGTCLQVCIVHQCLDPRAGAVILRTHDSRESYPGLLALFCWVLDPPRLPFLTPVCGTLLSDGQTLVSSSLFRTQILQPAREERLDFTHWKELESCLSVELGGRIKVPNWRRVGAVNKTPLPPPHPAPTHSWHLDRCLLRCESRRILPTVVVAARFIEALRKAQSWWPCCWSFKIGSDENFPFWKDCVSWRSHGSCLLFKKSIPVPNPTSHG